MRTNG